MSAAPRRTGASACSSRCSRRSSPSRWPGRPGSRRSRAPRSRAWPRQPAARDGDRSRLTAARSSTAWASSSRSARRRRRSTRTRRQIANPETVAPVVARDLGLDQERCARLALRPLARLRLPRAQGGSRRAKVLERREIAGLGFYPEERANLPAATSRRRASSATPASTTRASPASSCATTDVLAGEDRRGDDRARSARARCSTSATRSRSQEGEDRHADARHSPSGAGREDPAPDARQLGRQGSRRRSCSIPEPAGSSPWRSSPDSTRTSTGSLRDSADIVRNRAVTDTYEPGSTFKVVTVAAALEEGIVEPSTAFTLPPVARGLGPRDPRRGGAGDGGDDRVREILSRSSNVGAVMLAQSSRPKRRLSRWIDRFGFGRPTGVDFPGESRGIVLRPSEWTGSTIGNVPIGQGIAVTPLQMACRVRGDRERRGVARAPSRRARRRVESRRRSRTSRSSRAATAQALTRMMESVVEEGTGTEASVPGYTRRRQDGHGGEAGRAAATRTPATSPRSSASRRPAPRDSSSSSRSTSRKGEIYGGQVAAPAFREIAEFALQYLEVPPDDRPATTAG